MAHGLRRPSFATLTKLLRSGVCSDLQITRRAVGRKVLTDNRYSRQSLSFFTPFARFGADLRLFRFNPCFSPSRLVAMVTEISFARPADEGRNQVFRLSAAMPARTRSVETFHFPF